LNSDISSTDDSSLNTTDTSNLDMDDFTVDPSHRQRFGRVFLSMIFRILKVSSIYEVDHQQTRIVIGEFLDFFMRGMENSFEEEFSISIRDEICVVNGESLRLKRKAQERLDELHTLFCQAEIKGLLLRRSMRADDFVEFLRHLRLASRAGQGMKHVQIVSIEIHHGMPTRNIIESVMSVSKAMYVTHVYVRGLIKVQNMHQTVREKRSVQIPTGVVRRIVQSVSELLADEDYTILGLLPMRLVPPSLASHSFNSAIYAMLTADRLGIPPHLTTTLGMALIYQDLDRIGGVAIGSRDRDATVDPTRQYSTNLRDSAKLMGRLQGDIMSTLRILLVYERGNPYENPVGIPYYQRKRQLHLSARVVDVCRTLDLLIQGLEGYKSRRSDLAIQYLESRAGSVFDPALVKLIISTMGIYPIGTTVVLNTGEKAVVIKTPDAVGDPRRPVVRILNTSKPSVMDLVLPSNQHVEIQESIAIDPSEITVSKVFLLS
jgi:HD-GYP domain-containing protein (c-di-GMP phosphodiesterase class II)